MKPLVPLLLLACTPAFASSPESRAAFEEGLRLKAAQQLPAAATAFRLALGRDPDDVAALEQLALVKGWLGAYDESIVHWNQLLQREPARKGARLALARVEYWKGDRDSALRDVDLALSQTPVDRDAWVLKGDVLVADDRPAAAREAYGRAVALSGGDVDEALRVKLSRAADPLRWRLDIGGVYDHYSNTRGSEEAGYAQLGYQLTRDAGIYLHYDWQREFGRVDQSLLAGGHWRFAREWLVAGEVGGTPDADFRPGLQAGAAIEWLNPDYVQPLLAYRYLHYDTRTSGSTTTAGVQGKGDVDTVTPGLRLLAEGYGNLELRYGFTHNIDGSDTGLFQARINFATAAAFTPYLAYANGKEALPPQPAASLSVYSLGSTWDLSEHWSLRADLAYEHRDRFYDHLTAAGGISYRF